MIGYLEMISDKERAALNEALKQSGEEDLNNTLEIEEQRNMKKMFHNMTKEELIDELNEYMELTDEQTAIVDLIVELYGNMRQIY